MEKINDDIKKFVISKLGNQKRKNGEDYILHLYEVHDFAVNICEELNDKYNTKKEIHNISKAAFLHDIIGDTNTTFEEVLKISNFKIACWVKILSEQNSLPRIIRKEENIMLLFCSCVPIKIIKLADIYSNLLTLKSFDDKKWVGNYVRYAKKILRVLSCELATSSYYKKCKDLVNEYN